MHFSHSEHGVTYHLEIESIKITPKQRIINAFNKFINNIRLFLIKLLVGNRTLVTNAIVRGAVETRNNNGGFFYRNIILSDKTSDLR